MAAVEGEFIFDAVGGFLTSPIWNYPVRTFIEQNSLVFDPDGENHEAYQEIHKKYKEMVDTLLSSFIKDVGISEEQFMKACQEGRSSPQFNSINRDVFDHMWAAEDYEVFKRLMIQKNIELQLQALQLLQQVHNVQMPMPIPMQNQIPMPVSVAPPNSVPMAPSSSVPPPPGADEDAIMQEVLRRSKEEFESKQKDAKAKTEQEFERTLAESTEESKRLTEIAKREQDELEKALQISLEAQKMQTAEVEKLRDEVKKSTSEGSPQPTSAEAKPAPKPSPAESKAATKASPVASKTAPKPSPVKSKSPTQPKSQASGLPPLSVKTKKADTPVNAAEGWLKSAKEDAANIASVTPTQSKEVSEEEMKRRAAYLKQQRDKLMDLKRQEREKNLTKYTEQQPKARPTSSRAARQVTAGEQVPSPAAKSDKDGEKKLAMRRALADVLKREVVDKN